MCMTLEEIKRLRVNDIAAADAHLYLWTTNAFMVESHEVARAWGFTPKTILTWVKVKHDRAEVSMRAGYWYRSATEHIVFGVRGGSSGSWDRRFPRPSICTGSRTA